MCAFLAGLENVLFLAKSESLHHSTYEHRSKSARMTPAFNLYSISVVHLCNLREEIRWRHPDIEEFGLKIFPEKL